ncbi:unnamed protein product [Mycena citricolor]|uniref:Patatin-like phospholipase domain-containing protein n=1 Tax=Mycena citricolor TaxID=2018698 RepID=A0AAD2HIN9_9AGAR|nr:unnamed protein product [Mycena citricolor]
MHGQNEINTADYVNEAHIRAFSDALSFELEFNDKAVDPTGPPSPVQPTPPSRIRKVSALSDFAPHASVARGHNQELILNLGRGKKGLLRKNLRGSKSYEEWKKAALVMDDYLKFNEWKKEDEDAFYDWKLVRKVQRSLKSLRETFYGTKDLIEAYFDEQEKALDFIRETPDLTIDEKKRFFKAANTNLGASALCLSGGASFGYYHCGVVKALLDSSLLPRVITGTSAGGLIAALCCTRTGIDLLGYANVYSTFIDAELKDVLVPELANRITACEESVKVWMGRIWKTGARFDPIIWAKKCTFFTRGSLTFREAYQRTGRVLNISVIPADRHSPTRLLNYLTAPDTVIWSALLASAAVPGILPPVVLMQKLRDGSVVPWNWGSRFKDGSLRVDVPIQGWRGNFILSAAEQWLKHELTKNFKLIRDLELLPQLLGQDWSSVFLQRFDGNITIWPRTRFWDWIRILSDPDPTELQRMIRVGELVTWPKLHMISNRAKIEKQIYLGRQYVRQSLHAKAAALPATTPPATGSDPPLSVDTDAEAAHLHKPRPLVSNKRPHSGTSTPRDDGRQRDLLRSPAARRKWASNILHTNAADNPNDDSFFTLAAVERRLAQQQAAAANSDELLFSGAEHDLRQKFRRLIDPGILRPNAEAQAAASLKILLTISENLLREPDNPKYQKFKPTNSIIKRDIIDPKGTVEYARELGFSPEVDDFQPYYVFNPRKMVNLRIGAAMLKEAVELGTQKETRKAHAKKTEKAAIQAAADKVRLAYEDDRKRKLQNDQLEKERRDARMAAAARRAEEQAQRADEAAVEKEEGGDDGVDEEEEELALRHGRMPGSGHVLGAQPLPYRSSSSNKKTD